MPKRLVFVTVVAAGAAAAQTATQHHDSLPDLFAPTCEPIAGVASVIDGDTRIRFNGIDASESQQYCDDAKAFGDGASVASRMVEHGQALDWPCYSPGAVAQRQAKAEAA
ncbi:endonuclease YncB(thermonuclease family) [Mesorhizobium shonense]|uniref:Endonuclease YncB(Thermonuclease family) n=1 Tax=Mesorhizobium shonense TaxID=1209948 RepID=A0ABV2I2L3_9HYPH